MKRPRPKSWRRPGLLAVVSSLLLQGRLERQLFVFGDSRPADGGREGGAGGGGSRRNSAKLSHIIARSTWVHPSDRDAGKREDQCRAEEMIRLAKRDAALAAVSLEHLSCPEKSIVKGSRHQLRPPKRSLSGERLPGEGTGSSGGRRKENGMLFLNCEVNGKQMKAFVDTGAQVTVMSQKCAEEAGLMHLVDRRFSGRAVGVGTAQIIGRIHDAHLRIGTTYLTCSFSVIENYDIELLVGLDVLRKYECEISLSNNSMRFNAAGHVKEVAFLTRIEMEQDIAGRKKR